MKDGKKVKRIFKVSLNSHTPIHSVSNSLNRNIKHGYSYKLYIDIKTLL